MNKNMGIKILAVMSIVFYCLPVFANINMGVFPRRPAATTQKMFKPLADALSKQLGEKVNLVVPKDFPAFWKMLAEKKFDIVHLNQYHYIKSHKELGYQVFAANQEMGDKQIAGAITVRQDSGINSVQDLKGKTILFGGGEKAMGAYIAVSSILKKAGLVAGKDYKVKFAKNPPSAVMGVFNKAADAAGTGSIILKIKGIQKKIDVSQMKIVAVSDSFTHLSWAVSGSMPEDKVKKIRDTMVGLNASSEGEAILRSALVNNFYTVTDADFAKVREITEFVLGEKY